MKLYLKEVLLGVYMVFCSVAVAQQTITVENTTDLQRSELIAISAEQLGMKPQTNVVVRDVFGIEQQTQWTHDGKLLLSVYVRPRGKTSYSIQLGTPALPGLSWVAGRHYPGRLDDIAFENDRIGFRLYGPAMQRRGERGFGHDVWVKRTSELVLDELYRNDPRVSFHLDYGKALDCYGVGPTLGCGTPCNRASHPLARQGLELLRSVGMVHRHYSRQVVGHRHCRWSCHSSCRPQTRSHRQRLCPLCRPHRRS